VLNPKKTTAKNQSCFIFNSLASHQHDLTTKEIMVRGKSLTNKYSNVVQTQQWVKMCIGGLALCKQAVSNQADDRATDLRETAIIRGA